MKKPNPMIKRNGGNPIALCNRCSAIMCYVSCKEEDGEFCKVKEVRSMNNVDYIKTPVGETPPPFCQQCDMLFSYSLN